ncbi:MAG TPA: alpha/beta hydrolase [Chloroflexota bacterium]
MEISDAVRAQFNADFDGPARAIYEWTLCARRIPSTKRMLAQALRREMTPRPPPDCPQIEVPETLMRDVRREQVLVPGPPSAPDVRALVYHPPASAAPAHEPPAAVPPPALVYFHGGGWCLGEPEGVDLIARKLCLLAGVVVVSVAYRLAPEHPYPAGLDDCAAVYRWVRGAGAMRLGADGSRVVVGGDSAGGNLAAALTLRVRDEDGPPPSASLLLCPATDFWFERYESCRRLGPNSIPYDLPFLGYVRSAYAPFELWEHPYVSPLRGDLRGFGPGLVIAGGADPLCDDNRAFAAQLAAAGNDAALRLYDAMPHGFYYLLGLSREEDDAYQAMAAFLRRTLAPSSR